MARNAAIMQVCVLERDFWCCSTLIGSDDETVLGSLPAQENGMALTMYDDGSVRETLGQCQPPVHKEVVLAGIQDIGDRTPYPVVPGHTHQLVCLAEAISASARRLY